MPDYANRAPRIQPPLPIETIEIPPPPDEEKSGRSLGHLLLPMVMLLGYLLMGVLGVGRNIAFMVPMGLAMIATAAFSYRNHWLEKKKLQEAREAYINRLSALRKEMETYHNNQRLYYEHTHPHPDMLYQIGMGNSESRLGDRLWERRTFDHDFGSLRLGIGDIPSRTVYEISNNDKQENPLFSEAEQIAIDSRVLRDAPVIIPLFAASGEDGRPGAAQHSIGVAGNAERVRDFIRAQVVQFAAMHAPIDSQVYVIGSPQTKPAWDWALWLPHTNQSGGYVGDRMCFEHPYTPEELKDKKNVRRDAPEQFWARINKELESRQLRLEDSESQGDVRLPFMLVIVDSLTAETWLDEAISEAAVSLILSQGQELGAAILFLVPYPSDIPSDCGSVIELRAAGETIAFQYSEIGLNSPRYIGTADQFDTNRAQAFAQAIKDKTVRMGYGSDLVTSVSMLDLYDVQKIDELDILTWWQKSKESREADWLKVAIGKKSGGGDRELYFHQDEDGVHGMIAGTTGSGKSELLLTLIAGLAVNYDPSVLNFVLVDYKGGAAFEPFRNLPHVVDIVTNLDGKAVDRMFVAIRSELDRRSAILADHNVKHIVEYRKRGLHHEKPFPHLFIVVDEFAEMVSDNKEYKDRFDSITRLGRAIGVSLLLATQRPTGAVTDQMRSNMKLKICLRVETVDDSRELLGRPDATFLPSNIPGRAYLQVGKDSPQLLQIARAGGPYSEADEDAQHDEIIFGDSGYSSSEPDDEQQEITIVDSVVERVRLFAEEHADRQHKPWPDPLPELLPANLPVYARHLNLYGTNRTKNRQDQIVITPRLLLWLKDPSGLSDKAQEMRRQWQDGQAIDWQHLDDDKPFQVAIGLIDIPERAEQRLLNIDISVGPLVVFGAGGWGKTTFLQTLITALAAQLSPQELHVYALDFGRGGLSHLQALPHLARPIDVTEEARVERLLRVLASEIDRREPKIRAYGSLVEYNRHNPKAILPAILVVVDNFAEFKETYEGQIPQLVNLIRSGRSMGIYFAVSADQTSALSSRVYSLFTQRYALKMADSGDYQAIVGRASSILTETPGRGVVQVERQPCEFHLAVPTCEIETVVDEEAAPPEVSTHIDRDYLPYYEQIAAHMAEAWTDGPRPLEIEPLSANIPWQAVTAHRPQPTGDLLTPIGLRDIDRQLALLDLAKAPHCLLIGPPVSGKTTALKNMVLGLAERYTPQQVVMVLIDPKRTLFTHGGDFTFRNLPHVLEAVSTEEEMRDLIKRLSVEFYRETQGRIREYAQRVGLEDEQFNGQHPPPRRYVFVLDNYDDFADFEIGSAARFLSELARRFRDRGIHFVLSGSPEIFRNRDDLTRRVEGARYGLAMQSEEAVGQLGGRISYRMGKGELPAGRGFLVKSGQATLIQVANTHDDSEGSPEAQVSALDDRIRRLKDQAQPAGWFFCGTLNTYDRAHDASQNGAAHKKMEFEQLEASEEEFASMQALLEEFEQGADDKS